jgi:hypothetical protein
MSSKAERVFYIGLESTPGDGSTVDTALRAVGSFRSVVDKIRPDEDIGSYAPSRHYTGSRHGEGAIEMQAAYYQHLPYPISMALGAGSVDTGGTPEVWTFALPDATAPTFATYNIEYGDGADHIVRCADVFATEIEIAGEAGQAWTINAPLVGGSVSFPASHAATPTPPASPRTVLMSETNIYMDDTFGSIGQSVMNELISFNWSLSGLQHQKQFAGSVFPNGRGNDKWEITLEIVAEIENSKVESEKEKMHNNDLTAIRIRALAEDAGGVGIDWYVNIDGMYYLSDVSTLDDRDGNNIVTMTYIGQKDSSGNEGEIEIACDLQAL